jgi:hypothetical protein
VDGPRSSCYIPWKLCTYLPSVECIWSMYFLHLSILVKQPMCSSFTCTTPYDEFKLKTYKIISFDLKHLLYKVACQVGSLPSSKYWHVLFHVWPSYKPNGDIAFMLFPWRGKHCIPWCHLGCLYFHCQKCWVLCFTWTNTCPLIAIPYIFSLVGQYYMFSWNEFTF